MYRDQLTKQHEQAEAMRNLLRWVRLHAEFSAKSAELIRLHIKDSAHRGSMFPDWAMLGEVAKIAGWIEEHNDTVIKTLTELGVTKETQS